MNLRGNGREEGGFGEEGGMENDVNIVHTHEISNKIIKKDLR